MNKSQKEMILNGIINNVHELERLLPYLKESCKFGSHKGKLSNNDPIMYVCKNLAEDLQSYMDDDFSLEDMQNYEGKY